MTLRSLVLISSLAMVLGGCVVAPAPHANRTYYEDRDYYYTDDDYYDYDSTPAYEGYHYVRVIFIGNIPYYVDGNRHVQPIPRHMHDHFRKNRNKHRDRHAPYFSRDNEVRDGYNMSRVVYFNNVPYYVEDGRAARPLPNHMHERFRYAPAPRFMNNSRPGDRQAPLPPQQRYDDRRNEPPAYGRDWDRRDQPAYGRERDRDDRGDRGRDYERDRDRDRYTEPQQYERPVPNFLNNGRNAPPPLPPSRDERMAPNERERDDGGYRQRPYEAQRAAPLPNYNNGPSATPGRIDMQPAPQMREERGQPQQEQRGGDGPRDDAPAGNNRGRDEGRPQANNNSKDRQPNRKSRRDNQDEKDNKGPRFMNR